MFHSVHTDFVVWSSVEMFSQTAPEEQSYTNSIKYPKKNMFF